MADPPMPITTVSASQPTAQAMPAVRPGQVPLSADDLASWRGLITKSREARKTASKWWEANLKAYAPDLKTDPSAYGEVLNTNRDFTLVERKKADLFYQRPDLNMVPSPLMAGQPALIDTHEKILNEQLGADGVNAKALVQQALFDVLCTAGMGYTLMGYESVTIPTPMLNPATQQEEIIPVPVYERIFWEPFSPKQRLLPHDLKSTDLDRAASWLGMEFEIPIRTAKRKGWVPEDYAGAAPDPELHFDYGQATTGGDAVCKGVLIFYKSALFRDDRVHPLHQTKLVLIDGVDNAAEHVDSPYQTLDPQGRLTPDSLLGFPFHHATIRTLTDSADVPSDCTISRPLVNELNRFRGQMVEQRDANLMKFQYNTGTLPTETLDKAVRGRTGAFVGMPEEAYVGDGAIKELPQGQYPRENFQFNDYLDNDLARTHALDSNQSGAGSEGSQTATEAQITQSNVNARLSLERGNILDWYCKGATKFSTLLMRFLPTEQAAAIVGPEMAGQWDTWRKQVPATLAFTALPDSALRTDSAVEKKRAMDDYTYLANDPFINRQELLTNIMPKLGYDAKVINTQPPAKGPEPSHPTFNFKGEDLNPLAPQFAIVMEILKKTGIAIDPTAVQEAQNAAQTAMIAGQAMSQQAQTGEEANTQHGGKVPQLESLSKHAAALTGGLQGTGQPAPLGAAGGGLM